MSHSFFLAKWSSVLIVLFAFWLLMLCVGCETVRGAASRDFDPQKYSRLAVMPSSAEYRNTPEMIALEGAVRRELLAKGYLSVTRQDLDIAQNELRLSGGSLSQNQLASLAKSIQVKGVLLLELTQSHVEVSRMKDGGELRTPYFGFDARFLDVDTGMVVWQGTANGQKAMFDSQGMIALVEKLGTKLIKDEFPSMND
jgi:hypothetical protein